MARSLEYRINVALGNTPKNLQSLLTQLTKVNSLIEEVNTLAKKNQDTASSSSKNQAKGYVDTQKALEQLTKKQAEYNSLIKNFGTSFRQTRQIVEELGNIKTEIQELNKAFRESGDIETFDALRKKVQQLEQGYASLGNTVKNVGPIVPPDEAKSTGNVRPNSGGGSGTTNTGNIDFGNIPDDASLSILKEYRRELEATIQDVARNSAEFRDLSTELSKVNAAIQKSEQSFKPVAGEVAKVGNETRITSGSLEDFAAQIANISSRLRTAKVGSIEFDDLTKSLADVTAKYEAAAKAPKKLIEEQRTQIQLNAATSGSIEELKLRIVDYQNRLEKANPNTQQFTDLALGIAKAKAELAGAKAEVDKFFQQFKAGKVATQSAEGSIDNLKATVQELETQLKKTSPEDANFEGLKQQFVTTKAALDNLRKGINLATEDQRLLGQAASYPEESIKALELKVKQLTNTLKATDVGSDEFTKLAKEVTEAKTKLEDAQAVLKSFNKTGTGTPQAVSDLDQLEDRLSSLRSQYIKTQQAQKRLTGSSGDINIFNPRQRAAAKEFDNQLGEIQEEIKKVEKELVSAGGKIPKWGEELNKVDTQTKTTGKSFARLGVEIAGAFGIASVLDEAVDAFKEAVRVGAEFEAQMASVRAISGATADEFERLTANSRRLGAETSFTAQQAAEGAEILAVAGFSVQEILDAQEGVLRLAESAGVQLDKAADVAAITLRGYGLEAERISEVNDILTNSFTSANLTLDSFNEANKLVAPIAKQTGLELTETAAIINTLADAGFRGSIGGTALRAILVQLLKPSDKAKKALTDLGIELTDSGGNLRNLIDIVNDFNEAQVTNEQLSRIFGKQVSAFSILLERQKQATVGAGTSLDTYAVSLGRAGTVARAIVDPFKSVVEANRVMTSEFRQIETKNFSESLQEAADAAYEFNLSTEEVDRILKLLNNSGVEGAEGVKLAKEALTALTSDEILQKLEGLGISTETIVDERGIINLENYALQLRNVGATAEELNLNGQLATVFDELVNGLADVTEVNLPKFAEQLQKAAEENKQYNLTLEDTAALVQQLGEGGLDTSESIDTLSDVLGQVTNNAKLLNAFEGTQLQNAFTPDGTQVRDIQLLLDGLRQLRESGQELSNFDISLGADQQQGLDSLLELGNAAGETSDAYNRLKFSVEEYSTTQDIAQQKLDNVSGDFKILQSTTQELFITLFDKLAPTLRDLIQYATDIVRGITNWVGGLDTLNVILVENYKFIERVKNVLRILIGAIIATRIRTIALSIANSGLVKSFVSLIRYIGTYVTTLIAKRNAALAAAVAQRTLSGAMVATPWGAIAAAIGVVVGVIANLATKNDEAAAAFDKLKAAQDKYYDSVDEARTKNEELANQITNIAAKEQERANAIREAVKLYGEVNPEIAAQLRNAKNLAEVQAILNASAEKQIALEQKKKEAYDATLEAQRAATNLEKVEEDIDQLEVLLKDKVSLSYLTAARRAEINRPAITAELAGERRKRLEELSAAILEAKEQEDRLDDLIERREEYQKKLDDANTGLEDVQDQLQNFADQAGEDIIKVTAASAEEQKAYDQLIQQKTSFIEEFKNQALAASKEIVDADAFINEQFSKLDEDVVNKRQDLIENGLLNEEDGLVIGDSRITFGLSKQERDTLQQYIEDLAKRATTITEEGRAASRAAAKEFDRNLDQLRKQADKLLQERQRQYRRGIDDLEDDLLNGFLDQAEFYKLGFAQQAALLQFARDEAAEARLKLLELDIDAIIKETERRVEVINSAYEREAKAIRETYESRQNLLKQQLDEGIISQREYTDEIIKINEELDAKLLDARSSTVSGTEFVEDRILELRKDQAEKEIRILSERIEQEKEGLLAQLSFRQEQLQKGFDEGTITEQEYLTAREKYQQQAADLLVEIEEEYARKKLDISVELNNDLASLQAQQTEGLSSELIVQAKELERQYAQVIENIDARRDISIKKAEGNEELISQITEQASRDRLEAKSIYFENLFNLRAEYADSEVEVTRLSLIEIRRLQRENILLIDSDLERGLISQEEYNNQRIALESEYLEEVRKLQTSYTLDNNPITDAISFRQQALQRELLEAENSLARLKEVLGSQGEEFSQVLDIVGITVTDLNDLITANVDKLGDGLVNSLTGSIESVQNEFDTYSSIRDNLEQELSSGIINIEQYEEQLNVARQVALNSVLDLTSSAEQAFKEKDIPSTVGKTFEDSISAIQNQLNLVDLTNEQVLDKYSVFADKLEDIRSRISIDNTVVGFEFSASNIASLQKVFGDAYDGILDSNKEAQSQLSEANKNFEEIFGAGLSTYKEQLSSITEASREEFKKYFDSFEDIAAAERQVQETIFEARLSNVSRFSDAEKKVFDDRLLSVKATTQEIQSITDRGQKEAENQAARLVQLQARLTKELRELQATDLGIRNEQFKDYLDDTLREVSQTLVTISNLDISKASEFDEFADGVAKVYADIGDNLPVDQLIVQGLSYEEVITQGTQVELDKRLDAYEQYVAERAEALQRGDLSGNFFEDIRLEAKELQKDLESFLDFRVLLDSNRYNLPTAEIRTKFDELSGILQESVEGLSKDSATYEEDVLKALNVFNSALRQLESDFEIDIIPVDQTAIQNVLAAQTEAQLEAIGVSYDTLNSTTGQLRADALSIIADSTEALLNSNIDQKEIILSSFAQRRKDILRAAKDQEVASLIGIESEEEASEILRELAERTNKELADLEAQRLEAVRVIDSQITNLSVSEATTRLEILQQEKRLALEAAKSRSTSSEELQREIAAINSYYDAQAGAISDTLDEIITTTASFEAQAPKFDITEGYEGAARELSDYYDTVRAEIQATIDDEELSYEARQKAIDKLNALEESRTKLLNRLSDRRIQQVQAESDAVIESEQDNVEATRDFYDARRNLIEDQILGARTKKVALDIINAEERGALAAHNAAILDAELTLLLEKRKIYEARAKDSEEYANQLEQVNKQIATTRENISKEEENVQDAQEEARKRQRDLLIAESKDQFEEIFKYYDSIANVYKEFTDIINDIFDANILKINEEADERVSAINRSYDAQNDQLDNELKVRQDEIRFQVESETLQKAQLEEADRKFTERKEQLAKEREAVIEAEDKKRQEALEKEEQRKERLAAIEQALDAVRAVIASAQIARESLITANALQGQAIKSSLAAKEIAESITLTEVKIGQAIATWFAVNPLLATITVAGLIAAIGGAIIAGRNVVKNFKENKFEEGGEVENEPTRRRRASKSSPSLGGKLVGRRHRSGGIKIEVEGGEYIINREGFELYPELVEYINAQGLNKKKRRPYSTVVPKDLFEASGGLRSTRVPRIPRTISSGYAESGGAIIAGASASQVQNSKAVVDKLDQLVNLTIQAQEQESSKKVELVLSELKAAENRVKIVEDASSL